MTRGDLMRSFNNEELGTVIFEVVQLFYRHPENLPKDKEGFIEWCNTEVESQDWKN